ncbi:MAG TPA: cation transporter, partial [Rhodospirillales bacterium]|nr:cation transporter [Rhodospirillales bacterium]
MSEGCGCGAGTGKFDGMSDAYRRALGTVIAINVLMFCVEMTAGVLAGSQALKADALDFLADTLTYALSLFVIGRPLRVRATAALIKGLSLAVVGLSVFASTVYRVLVMGTPDAPVMGAV